MCGSTDDKRVIHMKNMFNQLKSLFSSKGEIVNYPDNTKNVVRVIYPRRSNITWSFDDPSVGLIKEPFVSGTDTIIDHVVKDFDSSKMVTLWFSDVPFTGHMYVLDWLSAEDGGNWYNFRSTEMKGWLCPALYKYFSVAPKSLYIKIKPGV